MQQQLPGLIAWLGAGDDVRSERSSQIRSGVTDDLSHPLVRQSVARSLGRHQCGRIVQTGKRPRRDGECSECIVTWL